MFRHSWTISATIALSLGLASFALAQEQQEQQPQQPAQPQQGQAQQGQPDGIQVTEILLGSELENGVPTAPKTQFSRADGRVYCVIRLQNSTGEEGSVRVAFERAEGEPQARSGGFRLEYPARVRYRTVARTSTSRSPGSYRCVVRNEEGQVLSHANFTLTE